VHPAVDLKAMSRSLRSPRPLGAAWQSGQVRDHPHVLIIARPGPAAKSKARANLFGLLADQRYAAWPAGQAAH
jgi:hypothetical protein